VFAGILAPIQMFPLWLQRVLDFLPFRYVLSFSIEIVTGRVQGERLIFGFILQAFWATFMVLAVRWVWARAMRSYSAVGA
jgi:ABC-2 type transport system permease protein